MAIQNRATTMTFREAFCQHIGCRPEQYSFEVYRRCVRTKLRFFLRAAWVRDIADELSNLRIAFEEAEHREMLATKAAPVTEKPSGDERLHAEAQ